MRKLNLKFICIISALIGGCVGPGGMIPGNLFSQNGQILDFAIEKTYGSGRVTAFNSKTNETFEGKYSAIGTSTARATAFLKGDKGSIIYCQMEIQAGLNPHGLGKCQDQKEIVYRVQF